jgi:hypothetical protein
MSKKRISIYLAIPVLLSLTTCGIGEDAESKYYMELFLEKGRISSMSIEEKYAYASKHLTTLAQGFLAIAKDEKFKRLIYEGVEKRFDGDFNVLIKDIFSQSSELWEKVNMSPYIKNASFESWYLAGILVQVKIRIFNFNRVEII